MASNFDQFGLKEVANVTFYDIKTNKPVLFLDSLKVSTIETSAENTEARGGWGNPALISWDYNKEVNLTLEDALFSAESMKVMMGADIKAIAGENGTIIKRNEMAEITVTPGDEESGTAYSIQLSHALAADTTAIEVLTDAGFATTASVSAEAGKAGKYTITFNNNGIKPTVSGQYRVFYDIVATDAEGAQLITISADSFGGTYKVVGDTKVRNRKTGKDEAFQFIIGKAKIQNEVTFTMEAEGDPATFNLPLKVLKDDNGNMFQMVKYGVAED